MTLQETRPLLTVVIPVYNEADTVERLVERVKAVPVDKEIILVDDYSTDGTGAKLMPMADGDRVRVLTHPKNRGKGAALRTGFQAARGDLVIVQDADLEYDPEEYPQTHQAHPRWPGRCGLRLPVRRRRISSSAVLLALHHEPVSHLAVELL
jgi:glycosyltransferase involved in cell wall biosynthesis